jgi:hypothetical protein
LLLFCYLFFRKKNKIFCPFWNEVQPVIKQVLGFYPVVGRAWSKEHKNFLKGQICAKLTKNFENKKDTIFHLILEEKKKFAFLFECFFQDGLCKSI